MAWRFSVFEPSPLLCCAGSANAPEAKVDGWSIGVKIPSRPVCRSAADPCHPVATWAAHQQAPSVPAHPHGGGGGCQPAPPDPHPQPSPSLRQEPPDGSGCGARRNAQFAGTALPLSCGLRGRGGGKGSAGVRGSRRARGRGEAGGGRGK